MALGHDVRDAHHFKHSSHRTASDDASTFGCWCHHHMGSAVMTKHCVVNRAVFEVHFGQVATGFFHRFLHGCWHFFRFALAHAHLAIAVTDHSQRCETEDTAALDHLGHAVHRDHLFAQTVFGTVALRFCCKFSHFLLRSV